MWARKLTYKMMVLGPFIMMSAIAVNSRTFVDDWTPQECGPVGQDRIAAYVEPCKQALALKHLGRYVAQPSEVRTVAQAWSDGVASGRLQALRPSFHGDSMQDGVKNEIMMIGLSLARRMEIIAKEVLADGKPMLASSDLLLALDVSAAAKYSDFVSVAASSSEQRRVVASIRSLTPLLNRKTAHAVAEQLEAHLMRVGQLPAMLERSRSHYAASVVRQGEVPLAIVDSEPIVRMVGVIRSEPTIETIRTARSLIVASKGDLPQMLTLARLAWEREVGFQRETAAAVQALRTR